MNKTTPQICDPMLRRSQGHITQTRVKDSSAAPYSHEMQFSRRAQVKTEVFVLKTALNWLVTEPVRLFKGLPLNPNYNKKGHYKYKYLKGQSFTHLQVILDMIPAIIFVYCDMQHIIKLD